ncbi:glia maturation factor beta [Moesziomyces antarcticus T-34]|uniref:Glia maturation factor beta n=1 Tax=Pseudozyma antarctica (strain T-34) TaxID=1151754 RepID=M9LZ38_PSEA3|nr:glia maturation factor beta [Moesziomyces antarcticus T-34]
MVIVSPAQKASQARIRNQGLLEANRRKVFYDDRPVKLPSPWNHAGQQAVPSAADGSRLRTGSLVCPLDSRMFARSAPQIFAHPTQDPRRQDWAEAAQRKLEAWWMPLPANVLRLACAAAFEPDNRTLDPQPAAV